MMPSWDEARNVLCVRLDSLGDVLMCTPAMRAVKQAGAGRTVTLLTSRSGAAAAPFIPELDGVITYAAPWVKSAVEEDALRDGDMVRQLAGGNFDAAIIFTSYSQSPLPAALLCHLAGIPLRLAHCRENPYRLLTEWITDPEPAQEVRHEVRRQLDLVSRLGWEADCARLSFRVPCSDLANVRQRLTAAGIAPGQPFVLMHPGASAASRRYPPASWSAVIAAVAARSALPIVLTGDDSECDVVAAIRQGAGVPGVHSMAGQFDLGQLGAAIALAAVVVSNNTGPAHMAAAIGTPLANLYAMTNPQHTPWQVHSRLLFHDVPCRFCYKSECPKGHHDCLTQLAPQQVIDAVCSLINWSLRHRNRAGMPVSESPSNKISVNDSTTTP